MASVTVREWGLVRIMVAQISLIAKGVTMETSPKKNNHTPKWGWLIAVSVVVGIVLSCAIVPLGGLAILVAGMSNLEVETTTTLPQKHWRERVVMGKGDDTRILLVSVSGVIGAPGGGMFGEEPMHVQFLSQIAQAEDDDKIRAVVVEIDSPGGGVVASHEMCQALRQLRTRKPVVVSMGSVAASGGYYVATPAHRIYANPDTLTGSLGVIISSLNYEEAFTKLGLRPVVFKSGKFKDILSPVREITPEEQRILQRIIDDAYNRFVDAIVEGRHLPREKVLQLADGRIYTGEQARDAGLVDELGNLEAAIRGARELAGLPEDTLVVRYESSTTLYDLLFSALAKQREPADPLGLRHLAQPSGPRLEYRADW